MIRIFGHSIRKKLFFVAQKKIFFLRKKTILFLHKKKIFFLAKKTIFFLREKKIVFLRKKKDLLLDQEETHRGSLSKQNVMCNMCHIYARDRCEPSSRSGFDTWTLDRLGSRRWNGD